MNMLKKTAIAVTIFAIAMAFLETSVVVYLRELFYAGAFKFPLSAMKENILVIEIGREFATLVMLLGIGYIAGKKFLSRFAWFLYSFAIWDIFYYIFLKVTINWPDAITDWDILFLIPLPWVGPVWAPCVISLTMILLAYVMIYAEQRCIKAKVKGWEWGLLALGSLCFIFSFTLDHIQLIIDHIKSSGSENELMNNFYRYVPKYYEWSYFLLAEIAVLIPITTFFWRHRKESVLTPVGNSLIF